MSFNLRSLHPWPYAPRHQGLSRRQARPYTNGISLLSCELCSFSVVLIRFYQISRLGSTPLKVGDGWAEQPSDFCYNLLR